jgi:hypothetical protein
MERSVGLKDVISALNDLGGEQQSYRIKEKVIESFGGVPEQYVDSRSFKETIQVIIQNNCPQEKKFKRDSVFEKVARGRFRLYENYKSISVERQLSFNTQNSNDDVKAHFHTFENLDATERQSIINSRIGQGVFRDKLVKWADCSFSSIGF